ncbi:hypothetical protein AXF42_Ash006512 [Apostasia shenzhenica]|uniref:Uncharacterized protein n=1 Tax=Apostasia shenzhenica TaxID=1088818 RepID=A0A2I0AZ98_9ASPA|nr:hypothetical protein AXF42_Ash006512 [Apostasia shenzhenica]
MVDTEVPNIVTSLPRVLHVTKLPCSSASLKHSAHVIPHKKVGVAVVCRGWIRVSDFAVEGEIFIVLACNAEVFPLYILKEVNALLY